MKPIEFPEANVKVAEHQPEYQTLPAYVDEQQTISCWHLTWRERFKLLWRGVLWLRQLNFGHPLQPQLPEVDRPFIDPEKEYVE